MSRPRAYRPQPGGSVPVTAMVMAAGLGKRMRPLTATRPKPLVEVAGRPLIDHVFDRLRAAGVQRVVVNVHYLADLLEAHLAQSTRGQSTRGQSARGQAARGLEVTVSDERALLMETGGGLVQARSLLGDEPFFVANADNLWVDGPVDALRLLASHWDDAAMDALLLLVPYARAHNHRGQGDFSFDRAGRLVRRPAGRVAPFVYTGVQILSPRLLDGWPLEPFSTNLMWDRAIADGRAFGVVHEGLWFDVGTPAAITKTEALLSHG